jgi:hypothetical protein
MTARAWSGEAKLNGVRSCQAAIRSLPDGDQVGC